MSAHTPGPWRIEYEEPFCPELVAPDGQRVVGVKLWEDDADAPGVGLNILPRANARLVAAAPELLEALEAALLRCEDCGTSGDAHCPACESARAAIAKAEGR